jgi:protein-S-isoprenylcysteine O-methyltransferase Ste14
MKLPLHRYITALILPFLATILVPYLLKRWLAAIDTSWSSLPDLAWLGYVLGALIYLIGLGGLIWCIRLFAQEGDGTLAPWDPTQKLVASGPYAYVRNPMIRSVVFMLLGEAIFFGSVVLGLWTAGFFLVNHGYFIVSEEPGLEKRFGKAYQDYKVQVPRWLPKQRPK